MARQQHGAWWVLGNSHTFTMRTPLWGIAVLALAFSVYAFAVGKTSGGLGLLGFAVLFGALSAAGHAVTAYARRRAAEQGDV